MSDSKNTCFDNKNLIRGKNGTSLQLKSAPKSEEADLFIYLKQQFLLRSNFDNHGTLGSIWEHIVTIEWGATGI